MILKNYKILKLILYLYTSYLMGLTYDCQFLRTGKFFFSQENHKSTSFDCKAQTLNTEGRRQIKNDDYAFNSKKVRICLKFSIIKISKPVMKSQNISVKIQTSTQVQNKGVKMLKPKSQVFKLKFHLAKVQAVNNKVNSRVHAYLHIDNEQLEFKGAPELKKNIAIFGSDLEYDNFMISYDQITGLYEQKKALLVIEFETQGAYIKIGEVSVNLGEILNQKKYRVVNVYPLSKCYDKSAKVKLAVDFVPMTEKKQGREQAIGQGMNNNNMNKVSNQTNFKQTTTVVRKEQMTGSNVGSNGGNVAGYYKNPTGMIKSRLAQEENVILQERIYEYEKRMDNYRISQNQLSQRMQQQLERKDEKISQLSLELTKQQNTIHLITLQNESFKTQIKQLTEQSQLHKLQIKSHLQTIQELQRQLTAQQKQIQSKIISLQNLQRTKQNKQKHLTQQIQKYTQRYSQSEQQRNKLIFELENKLKLQLEKKDQHYQELIKVNEIKYLESLKAIKERNKFVETEHKHMEQQSQEQDSKVKALSLQLQKALTLTQQQEQEMLYLNQQLTKVKKLKETQNNQLDSINFSYQQTVNQLQQQKEHNKQLAKKLQLLKTELSLSNQTIQQQRERIIVMNKDLQVREQRQYYMKEHYQQDIYDREVLQNNLRAVKQELQLQLKRTKQQLKLASQKTEEEHSKNQLLKSTIENLEKQISTKNSLLMKLGEDKLYLQTETKNSKQLITQLEEELTKLQGEKAYLTEALMEKKISIENDKSLEWTYKIESLQNDIQLMVDKFKSQKETMKENFRKEQSKKVQEINKLNTLNKKLKEDVDDMKDKLSKRQSYLSSIQKSLKQEKQKSLDYQRQLASIKQTYRLILTQKQSLQHTVKQLSRTRDSKQKLLQQTEKQSQKYKKQLSQIKNGFNRLISMILEHMVKRYNERVSFQDIGLDLLVDGQIVAYVNVALKKFCDDHNRTRELIKELEEFKKNAQSNIGENRNINENKRQQGDDQYLHENGNYEHKYQNRKSTTYNHQQQQNYPNKRLLNQKVITSKQFTQNSLQLQSPFNVDPIKQLESYRYQVDRLKKQQAQNKVKVKSLEQEIEKQERNGQNSKFELSRVKNQLQEAQDQITRVNFVLRKKDKIIKQLQTELQQLQKQSHDLRSNSYHNTSYQKPSSKPSNFQTISQNPSLPIIRELQSKLNLKSEQLSHVQKQVQSLREQYTQELNEVKKLQGKLKEKSTRILVLEKELDVFQMKRTDDKDKEIMRLRKMLDKETEEKQKTEDKVRVLQGLIKDYQLQVSCLQSKNKQLCQQLKLTEHQFRRNLQSNQYLLNDKSTLYQTQILQLKSELSQQHQKCSELAHKHSQLSVNFAKKNQQLQQLKQRLALKEKQLLRLQEIHEEEKNRMVLKVNGLNDKVRQLETLVEGKSFELQQCKFAYQGRVLQLERQMDEFRDGLIRAGPNSAR